MIPCAQRAFSVRGARLRSKTPDLVRQEFYGLMMAHFAIRGLMHEAALKADEDPDQLSFLHAVRVIRRKMAVYGAIPPLSRREPFIRRSSTRYLKNASYRAATGAIPVASGAR